MIRVVSGYVALKGEKEYIWTLFSTLFDKLIWLELVEGPQALVSSTNQSVKQDIKFNSTTSELLKVSFDILLN